MGASVLYEFRLSLGSDTPMYKIEKKRENARYMLSKRIKFPFIKTAILKIYNII